MRKTLIVAAIVLAIGIPAATIANRQWSAKDHKTTAAKADMCCPVEKPAAGDASAPKDGASCPYMADMEGKAPAHPAVGSEKPASKPASADEVKMCPVASGAPASTKPAVKATVKPPAEKKVVSAICPVMKNEIPDVTKAAGHSVYKGKTYYFCCAGCKPLFDKDPDKYLGQ